MKAYLALVNKSFQNNLVYRLDFFSAVINTLVMIFVNVAIWKAIYEEEAVLGGIQFRMLTTYIVLSLLTMTLFMMDEYLIENKVRSGLISTDLLKPYNFRLSIFSYQVGTLLFRALLQMLPSLIICAFLFRLLPPFNLVMALGFFASLILGYLVLYNINFIVWVSSFWFYWTFSLVTIKDALLLVLTGAIVPLWFMPGWLYELIKLTPLDSIFYAPISIYLGRTPMDEIGWIILKQIVWIFILFGIGKLLWMRATKRLVIQGG